jgi:hypothetical protein
MGDTETRRSTHDCVGTLFSGSAAGLSFHVTDVIQNTDGLIPVTVVYRKPDGLSDVVAETRKAYNHAYSTKFHGRWQ